MLLRMRLRDHERVFLDSDDLRNLAELLQHVAASDVLVVLLVVREQVERAAAEFAVGGLRLNQAV